VSIRKSIARFQADERGTESVEYGIVGVVVAAGSVQGMLRVQEALDAKVADALAQIDAAD
jgi:Flp pilus assembly pilin Flp